MCHGFHFAVIKQEGSFHQCFAVTCGAGADDVHIFRKLRIDFLQGADGCFQGAAVIAGIKGVEQGAVLPYQCDFGGGGTGINAKVSIALVTGKLCGAYMGLAVAFSERSIILLVCKQRFHALYFKFHFDVG